MSGILQYEIEIEKGHISANESNIKKNTRLCPAAIAIDNFIILSDIYYIVICRWTN